MSQMNFSYSYSIGLSDEERRVIDEGVEQSRSDFRRGFMLVTGFTVTVWSLYIITKSVANAVDSSIPGLEPVTPGDPCPVPGRTLPLVPTRGKYYEPSKVNPKLPLPYYEPRPPVSLPYGPPGDRPVPGPAHWPTRGPDWPTSLVPTRGNFRPLEPGSLSTMPSGDRPVRWRVCWPVWWPVRWRVCWPVWWRTRFVPPGERPHVESFSFYLGLIAAFLIIYGSIAMSRAEREAQILVLLK